VSINVGLAASQANKVNQYSEKLAECKRILIRVKSSLNHGWNAQEMTYINQTIDSINQEIADLSSKLRSISSDVLSVAHDIKREEDAKEKAEAEAKAKAEAEALKNSIGK
jgi:uncharacterized protein YfcZ (UPF0381/DUF406 family)